MNGPELAGEKQLSETHRVRPRSLSAGQSMDMMLYSASASDALGFCLVLLNTAWAALETSRSLSMK